jgi:hypothetical protein
MFWDVNERLAAGIACCTFVSLPDGLTMLARHCQTIIYKRYIKN